MLTVIQGDSALKLAELDADSVHLMVTSPPYDKLRTYGGYPWDFENTARQMFRVLVPGGVVCWVVNDGVENGSESVTSCEQKIFFRKQAGFFIHDTMIYKKPNFSQPEKVRYHQTWEYIFVLSKKGAPRVFNPIMDRRNKYAGSIGSLGKNTFTNPDGTKGVRPRKINAEFGLRHNVWEGLTRGQEEMCKQLLHPAMMPRWLARDLIISWSNEGDTVLDPFAGSGTTCQEALKLGRKAIAIEINPNYISLIYAKNFSLATC
jgi:DNA modification methylase